MFYFNNMEVKILVCPHCQHKWAGKIIEGKLYYQCPLCKKQAKLEEFTKKRVELKSVSKNPSGESQ